MTKEKLQELRQRMIHHKVVNDVAVVELTAQELGELLDFADEFGNVVMDDNVSHECHCRTCDSWFNECW